MTAILLDTHVWAWTLIQSSRLSKEARIANDAATVRLVSPVSFYEVAQKVRLGKWPEMMLFVGQLTRLIREQGIKATHFDVEVCLRAGTMDWAHRDPFDRLLAATALRLDVPIISADPVFDGIARRIW